MTGKEYHTLRNLAERMLFASKDYEVDADKPGNENCRDNLLSRAVAYRECGNFPKHLLSQMNE